MGLQGGHYPLTIEMGTCWGRAGVATLLQGSLDPVGIARQAYSYALEHGYDTMIVETAGRQICQYIYVN